MGHGAGTHTKQAHGEGTLENKETWRTYKARTCAHGIVRVCRYLV